MPDKADIRTELHLYSALERGEAISQIALSQRLSVSVGLVNALLKRILQKGFAKAQAVPPRRWAYYLTPKGFSEKSELISRYLDDSLTFFREARQEYLSIFISAQGFGVRKFILAGKGELAEIAMLAAREASVEVVGIFASTANEESLYGLPVTREIDAADRSVAYVITASQDPQAIFEQMRTRTDAHLILAPAFMHISNRSTLSASVAAQGGPAQ